jgi:carbonic anhydrase
MQLLIDRARTFPHRVAPRRAEFRRLAEGQRPEALFISCSDSRVVPSLITGAEPGQLFELRTAGNIVPAYRLGHPTGEAATVEFAIEVLGVSDVVVCGHSHCGAVGALVRGDDLAASPATADWLAREASRDLTEGQPDPQATPDAVDEAVRSHVLAQLARLRGYPAVHQRLVEGRIRLHGWFYEIDTGTVLAHRPDQERFLPL